MFVLVISILVVWQFVGEGSFFASGVVAGDSGKNTYFILPHVHNLRFSSLWDSILIEVYYHCLYYITHRELIVLCDNFLS